MGKIGSKNNLYLAKTIIYILKLRKRKQKTET
jgi:hypothetical protein